MTSKQMQALPLLISGMSAVAVCKELKIHPSTISGWFNHDEEFMAEFSARKQLLIDNAISQLHGAFPLAISVAQSIMLTSKNEAIRLKAAALLMEKGIKLYGL